VSKDKAALVATWDLTCENEKRCQQRRSDAFSAAFKVGDEIIHDKGRGMTTVKVVRADSCPWSDDTLVVRNPYTGKEYHLGAYHVLSVNGVLTQRAKDLQKESPRA